MQFVATANANGTGSFSYSVTDNGGTANVDKYHRRKYAITVIAVNDAPIRTAAQ